MDRDLLRAAKRGDLQAKQRVASWLFVFLRQRGWSQDLIQETMKDILLKFVTHGPLEPEALQAWALSYAHMEVKTQGRQEQREQWRAAKGRQLARVEAQNATSATTHMVRRQQRQLMLRCIELLPALYREALHHHLGGGDHREFSQREGVSLETARQRLWKARQLLRETVQRARVTRKAFRSPQPS